MEGQLMPSGWSDQNQLNGLRTAAAVPMRWGVLLLIYFDPFSD